MKTRGFTLLEVLVAVAILGLGLTAILSAQAGAFASAAHARNVSLATGLLRCKMSEVEEHLFRDGFAAGDESGAGPCCEGDDGAFMRCAWRVEQPTFPDGKFGDMNLDSSLSSLGSSGSSGAGALGALGMLSQASGGASLAGSSGVTDVAKTLADANSAAGSAASSVLGTSPGATPAPGADPSAAGGGMGDMVAQLAMSIVYPNLKILFEASTRRVTSVVTFREGNTERSIEVMEWFAIPNQGLATDDGSTDTSSTGSGTTGKGGASGAARPSSGAGVGIGVGPGRMQ